MSTNPTIIHPASVPPTTHTTTHTTTTTTPSSPTQQRLSSAQAAAANTFHSLADQANVLGEKAKSHPLVQEGVRGAEEGLNSLDRQLAKFGFLNDLEARTNIPKTYGVLGFGVTLGLLIILNLFGLAQPITNLIGWALPAYLSCQALESPQKGDDAQWLCYWIVFGTLNFLESAALRVILYYVPWYFTVKLFATLWLMLPQTRGAEQVYYAALRPLFQQGKQKAAQLQAPTPIPSSLHAHSHSTSTSTHTDSASPSLGYSSGVSTHASQLGGTGTNPFVSTSVGGSGLSGLHTTSAGSTSIGAGGYVPPAAGIPLPDTPGKL